MTKYDNSMAWHDDMMIIVTLAMINLPRGQILATEVGRALTVPIAASEKAFCTVFSLCEKLEVLA